MDDLFNIQHPHDALFRAVFGDPVHAAELLKSAFPAEISKHVDWESLRRIDGSFVDERLRGQQADLLFEATMGNRSAMLYVLNEHKSEHDPFTALQLLRYIVAIWERHRREQPDATSLPPVLPIVIHHGRRPWYGTRELAGLLALTGIPRAIAARQPVFSFEVDDLTELDDNDWANRQLSVRTLLPLLHLQWMRRAPDTAALLLGWRALFRRLLATPGGRSIAHLLVSYTAVVSQDEPERLRRAFHKIEPAMKTNYMTTAEQLMHQANVKLLVTQLEQRFGPLDEQTLRRLRDCSLEQFDQIARRILTAATVEEVFAS